jgi:hypothetical protein
MACIGIDLCDTLPLDVAHEPCHAHGLAVPSQQDEG